MIIVRAQSKYPVPKKTRGRHPKWPWESMAIGEHFLMPGTKMEAACGQHCEAARRYGRKYTASKTGPGTNYPKEKKGVMIWRVE